MAAQFEVVCPNDFCHIEAVVLRNHTMYPTSLESQSGQNLECGIQEYAKQFHSAAHPRGGPAPRRELKSLHYFRSTWSRLSVDKQLAKAIEQAPSNAGSLNSHHLVLQALARTRQTSPGYLNHFISYIDTLLALDPGRPTAPLNATPAKSPGKSAKASKTTKAGKANANNGSKRRNS